MQCNYGNCQTTFHPTCARSAGFYLNVKSTGGNFQHKAYCEKHSLEQKMKVCLLLHFLWLEFQSFYLGKELKFIVYDDYFCISILQAETQKHGVEELKGIKQIRVRVLCPFANFLGRACSTVILAD